MKKTSFALVLWALLASRCAAATPVRVCRLDAAGSGSQRHYFGAVQGSQRVNLSFRVPGPLTEIPVDAGTRVKKGQLVARIDPRDFRTRLADAKSRLSQAAARNTEAQNNFRRYGELFKKQVISQAQYDQYKTALDVTRSSLRTAEAGVDEAEHALADTELRAPFAGVIIARLAEQFQDVQAKQPVVSLQNLESVEIVVNVPEEDIVKTVVGSESRPSLTASPSDAVDLRVTIDALPGQSFAASFKEISAQSDPRTRTYAATVVMPQPAHVRVLPGMTVLVSASVPSAAADDGGFAVPLEAVVGDMAGATWLWKYRDDGSVEKIPVTLGEFRDSRVQVKGAISAGDLIVTEGARGLSETSVVRPIS